MTNKEIGKYGEELAKEFLIKNKFKILECNFHYSKMAEIDIIAEKNKILHFIEVKTRSSDKFGTPFEAVNKKKMFSIFSAANFYMQKNKPKYEKFQIDIIGIILNKDSVPEIKFLENISL